MKEIDPECNLLHTDKISRKKIHVNFYMCKLPCLNSERFVQLYHLPDPVLAMDSHYKKFNQVFGTSTTE